MVYHTWSCPSDYHILDVQMYARRVKLGAELIDVKLLSKWVTTFIDNIIEQQFRAVYVTVKHVRAPNIEYVVKNNSYVSQCVYVCR